MRKCRNRWARFSRDRLIKSLMCLAWRCRPGLSLSIQPEFNPGSTCLMPGCEPTAHGSLRDDPETTDCAVCLTVQSVLPATASSANMRQNTERRVDAGSKESKEMISTIVYCDVLTFSMAEGPDIVDISAELNRLAGRSGLSDGVLNAFSIGSTGSLTTIEFEPGVVEDLNVNVGPAGTNAGCGEVAREMVSRDLAPGQSIRFRFKWILPDVLKILLDTSKRLF